MNDTLKTIANLILSTAAIAASAETFLTQGATATEPEETALAITEASLVFLAFQLVLLRLNAKSCNANESPSLTNQYAKPLAGKSLSPALLIAAIYLWSKFLAPTIEKDINPIPTFSIQVVVMTALWASKVIGFHAKGWDHKLKAPYENKPTTKADVAAEIALMGGLVQLGVFLPAWIITQSINGTNAEGIENGTYAASATVILLNVVNILITPDSLAQKLARTPLFHRLFGSSERSPMVEVEEDLSGNRLLSGPSGNDQHDYGSTNPTAQV